MKILFILVVWFLLIGCSGSKADPVEYGDWQWRTFPPCSWVLYNSRTGDSINGEVASCREAYEKVLEMKDSKCTI